MTEATRESGFFLRFFEASDNAVTPRVGVIYDLTDSLAVYADAARSSKPNFKVAAGQVRSRGFDLNVAGNLTPEWRVIGGYAYVDAEVTKDNTLRVGTHLANIPRNSFSLLNVYEFQDGSLKGLGLGAGAKYVDERVGQTSNTPFTMDAYTVVDLLGYYKVNDKVRLNLDVKNLFNRDFEEGAFGNFYAYPGAPRTVQVGIAYTL